MKHTLSYNRQLFNVMSIAEAELSPIDIPEGSLGIVDVFKDKTVAPESFEDLPKKFRLVYKHEGKLIYGFDCIEKKDIVWTQAKEYTPAKKQKWEGVVKHCNCINSVTLNIFIQDESLNRAMGLPWGTNDFYVEVSPEEFKCYCSCNEAGAYANNVLTMLLYKNILKQNSPFYTASVETVGGEKFDTLEDVLKFIEKNKEVNTNADSADDADLLKLVIEAKEPISAKRFNPYNQDYRYPAGVRILPSANVNSGTLISFTEVQPMEFEVGAGIDLVYEEYENKSYYTNVGSYARNMHLIEFPEFQFSEAKKYDTLTLEFDTPKTLRAGEADMKRFMFLFGSEKELRADVHEKLKAIFTPA